jgi:hypothetical protein
MVRVMNGMVRMEKRKNAEKRIQTTDKRKKGRPGIRKEDAKVHASQKCTLPWAHTKTSQLPKSNHWRRYQDSHCPGGGGTSAIYQAFPDLIVDVTNFTWHRNIANTL